MSLSDAVASATMHDNCRGTNNWTTVMIETIEPRWIYPEMKEVFDKLAELRDDVWRQCRIELGEYPQDNATATQIADRRFIRDPKRRAEIIESYRRVVVGYEAKMAELVGKYTAPQVILKQD